MITRRTLAAAGLAGAGLGLVGTLAAAETRKPRLVVQITMDQLRADLLQRYRPVFNGGLARILRGGAWIREGEVDHGLTNSMPGHATLATGRHPSGHGLTANEWWVEKAGKWTWISATDDPAHPMAGYPDRTGGSLRYMTGTTLADWIKAADPAAKAVALSTGGTVAVPYGGRNPDAAYWFDPRTNAFVTSTGYGRTDHDWLLRFNAEGLKRHQLPIWTLTVGEKNAGRALPDPSAWENGGRNQAFPHDFAIESRRGPGEDPMDYGAWFADTPMKEDALFALAASAVDAERLGQRGTTTDYLAVLVDSTDSIGHNFGPLSLEQLDNLQRLDRALGDFLAHLDRTVGTGAWVLALSADHGVPDPPEAGRGRRLKKAEIEVVLDRVEALAAAHAGPPEALPELVAAELIGADFIADAYSKARLSRPSSDPFVGLYQRSSRTDLTYDFPLVDREGTATPSGSLWRRRASERGRRARLRRRGAWIALRLRPARADRVLRGGGEGGIACPRSDGGCRADPGEAGGNHTAGGPRWPFACRRRPLTDARLGTRSSDGAGTAARSWSPGPVRRLRRRCRSTGPSQALHRITL